MHFLGELSKGRGLSVNLGTLKGMLRDYLMIRSMCSVGDVSLAGESGI